MRSPWPGWMTVMPKAAACAGVAHSGSNTTSSAAKSSSYSTPKPGDSLVLRRPRTV